MKLLLCILLIPVFSFAQKDLKDVSEEEVDSARKSIPVVDSQYEYTEVVPLDTTYTKAILYMNAKLFFAEIFKNASDVLQYDDKEGGKVIGKGSFELEGSQSFLKTYNTERRNVNFTIEISCKGGRYKYRIYHITSEIKSESNAGNNKGHDITGTLTLDEAYLKSQKGMTKKLDRKLFYYTVSGLKETTEHIKTTMAKKSAAADF
jgi:hypothetical protein